MQVTRTSSCPEHFNVHSPIHVLPARPWRLLLKVTIEAVDDLGLVAGNGVISRLAAC